MKKGDRYAFKSDTGFVIEVISQEKQVLVSNTNNRHNYLVGMTGCWGHYIDERPNWVYLGNFDKSNNFNNLYDKLNEAAS